MAQAKNENPVETGYDKHDCFYEPLCTLTTAKSRGLIAKNAVETAFSAVELLQFTALPSGEAGLATRCLHHNKKA